MATANLVDGDLQLWVDDSDNNSFATTEKLNILAAEVSLDTDDKTLIWTPGTSVAASTADITDLQAEHECRLVIKFTTTDESGQDVGENTTADISYRFTTGAGPAYLVPQNLEGGAPVATVAPAKFAEDFVKSDPIEVRFNETIDYKTIKNVEIRKGAEDGDVVEGTWYVDDPEDETLPTANVAKYYFVPKADLEAATKYYVVVPETVTDPRGNKATPYNYYFTVKDTKVPVPTITMPTEYDGAIIVTYNTDMTTGAENATDPGCALAYTVTVNGTERYVMVSYDEDDDIATLRLNEGHIPTNNQILKVTVKAGITATNGQVTAAAVNSPEVQISNSDDVTDYGIKSAVWDATNKTLKITLDRPADGKTRTTDLTGLQFSAGVTADNFYGITMDDDNLVINVALKDFDSDSDGDIDVPVDIRPGVTQVRLTAYGDAGANDDLEIVIDPDEQCDFEYQSISQDGNCTITNVDFESSYKTITAQ
jgi:hypothetical protein